MAILPAFDPAAFDPGAPIDNPYFPLRPGTILSYSGTLVDEETGESETESSDFFTTFETRQLAGIEVVVVRHTEYADGVLVEDTLDWHAQDQEGNVWYLGEIAYNYEFDDDGNWVETNNDGSWEAGVDGAQPGWIMRAEPGFGAAYYQEFAPGIAEDEGIVAGANQEVEIGLGTYQGVLQTLDTTALEPDVAEFKYYAPDVGQIRGDEDLDENGEPGLLVELVGTREVTRDADGEEEGLALAAEDETDDIEDEGNYVEDAVGEDDEGEADENEADDVEFTLGDLVDGQPLTGVEHADDPDPDDFVGDLAALTVSFLADEAGYNNALGGYSFDLATGEIGEGRILFGESNAATAGDAVEFTLGDGQGLGLFLIPNVEDLGVDLSAFEDGGLSFRHILTGEAATIEDGLAPLVLNEDGAPLPLHAFHALGNDDGFNFLNPAAGVHAVEQESELLADDDVGFETILLGFEDLRATEARRDDDFDDLVVAVSDGALAPELLDGLLGQLARADAALV